MPHIVAAGGTRVVWHQGRLIKRRVNPVAHAKMLFPANVDWRSMVVGAYGAVEYGPRSPSDRHPVAVYPTWHFGEPWERLIELCESDRPGWPWDGEDEWFRPRRGQGRRIVIVNWPGLNENIGKKFFGMLAELQEEYPETVIHLFEGRYFRAAFSFGLRAVDLEPLSDARFKRVHLPNGKLGHIDRIPQAQLQWIHMLGYSAADLHDPQMRIRFNIDSAMWAGKHFGEPENFRVQHSSDTVDPDAVHYAPTPVKLSKGVRAVPIVGDKIACDHCSLFDRCKLARVGGVCTLPGSETAGLAKLFKTRDSERIVQGLGELMALQAERVEKAMGWEDEAGELDPELTKVLQSMMDGGVKLAKLVDPQLAQSGPKLAIQINSGAGPAQVTAVNPASLMAAIVRELEAGGIPRDQITPEMIMRAVGGNETAAIETSAHDAA